MKFLFWNIKKNSIGRVLSDIAEEHKVDVVILAECSDKSGILGSLNAANKNLFHLTDSSETRVVIYTRFSRRFINAEYHDKHLTVRRVSMPRQKEILLAAIHFPSKLHLKAGDQGAMASRLSAKVREVESRIGHSRTVLIGDLNMNPFEEGMVSASGWHAVMTRNIARKGKRSINKEFYPFFYNPMWGRFGDNTEGPPGTYYEKSGSFIKYFWHMFDQVLIRPDLLKSFDNASLQILTECGSTSFIKRSGIPDDSRFSDHLPLLFALKI